MSFDQARKRFDAAISRSEAILQMIDELIVNYGKDQTPKNGDATQEEDQTEEAL